jgi:hypothetical protein
MPPKHTYSVVDMLISSSIAVVARAVQVVSICYRSVSFLFTFGKGRAYYDLPKFQLSCRQKCHGAPARFHGHHAILKKAAYTLRTFTTKAECSAVFSARSKFTDVLDASWSRCWALPRQKACHGDRPQRRRCLAGARDGTSAASRKRGIQW